MSSTSTLGHALYTNFFLKKFGSPWVCRAVNWFVLFYLVNFLRAEPS